MDTQRTIYLNHAGTSWPKPDPVLKATASLLECDPKDWPSKFESAHQSVAEFLHVDHSRLLLTPSCTAALSVGIMDHSWRVGDRVLTSHYEHHALHRNLVKLHENGVQVTVLPRGKSELIRLEVLENELKRGRVRLVALTAACNVTGHLLPISEAIELAHEYGAIVLIDGAQIAGWWDLNVTALGADLFAFAGHKGPQGPWGVGGLFVSPNILMNCPAATCDVEEAHIAFGCTVMPGYCDVGSANTAALVGLAAGCRWLSTSERANRLQNARALAREFSDAVRDLPGVTLHDDLPIERKVPTVAITVDDVSSIDMASQLRANGLLVSGGFQCALKKPEKIGAAAERAQQKHRGYRYWSWELNDGKLEIAEHPVNLPREKKYEGKYLIQTGQLRSGTTPGSSRARQVLKALNLTEHRPPTPPPGAETTM